MHRKKADQPARAAGAAPGARGSRAMSWAWFSAVCSWRRIRRALTSSLQEKSACDPRSISASSYKTGSNQ